VPTVRVTLADPLARTVDSGGPIAAFGRPFDAPGDPEASPTTTAVDVRRRVEPAKRYRGSSATAPSNVR
jgi:hypothetical protein